MMKRRLFYRKYLN